MRDDFEKVALNKYGYYELKNKPSLEERQKEFEEEYYQNSESTYEQRYSEEEKRFFSNKLEQKRMIIEKNIAVNNMTEKNNNCIETISDISLLDIACGEGFVLDYFSRIGCKVKGIDFSEWGIKQHNSHMLDCFIKGNCEKILPELIKKGEKYDVVNIDSALDMMLEPEKIVEYVKDLLTERGIFLLKVANNYSHFQQHLLETGQVSKEHWLDDPGHISYYNKDGLGKFMADKGFDCVEIYGESFIEFNLLNPDTNYYEKQGVGKNCYKAKVQLENMLHSISPEKSLEIFRLLGEMGLGREIIGVFKKRGE